MARKTLFLSLLTLFMGLAAHCAHADETFPFPEELQPDVDFWVSIFTRYGTDEGVLHDNRDLAVVYERIDMPSGISRQVRNRRVKKRRDALIERRVDPHQIVHAVDRRFDQLGPMGIEGQEHACGEQEAQDGCAGRGQTQSP